MSTLNSEIRRGDLYYADLSPVVGSEQGGVRPVLIIQNNIGNKYSPTVIVAAITSQINKAKLPTHIEISANEYGPVSYTHLDVYKRQGYDILAAEESVEKCDYDSTLALANQAMDLYKKGEIDELYICYTEFISPLTQTPKLMKVLPLAFDKEEGKSKDNSGSRARVQYLPSPEAVLSYLIPKYVSGVVYDGEMCIRDSYS